LTRRSQMKATFATTFLGWGTAAVLAAVALSMWALVPALRTEAARQAVVMGVLLGLGLVMATRRLMTWSASASTLTRARARMDRTRMERARRGMARKDWASKKRARARLKPMAGHLTILTMTMTTPDLEPVVCRIMQHAGPK